MQRKAAKAKEYSLAWGFVKSLACSSKLLVSMSECMVGKTQSAAAFFVYAFALPSEGPRSDQSILRFIRSMLARSRRRNEASDASGKARSYGLAPSLPLRPLSDGVRSVRLFPQRARKSPPRESLGDKRRVASGKSQGGLASPAPPLSTLSLSLSLGSFEAAKSCSP